MMMVVVVAVVAWMSWVEREEEGARDHPKVGAK